MKSPATDRKVFFFVVLTFVLSIVSAITFAVDSNFNKLDDAWESRFFQTNVLLSPTNIVAWWPVDGSVTNLVDKGPNHIDGILSNFSNPFVSDTNSFYQALRFNTNSTVIFPTNYLVLVTNQLTFSTWISGVNTNTGINIAKWSAVNGTTSNSWTLGLYTNGTAQVSFKSGTNATYTVRGSTLNLRDGSWHHIAFTYDQNGRVVNLYVDGDLQKSSSLTLTTFDLKNIRTFTLGSSVQFPFTLDEIRLYSRALGSDEILLLPPTYSDLDGDGKTTAEEEQMGTNPWSIDTDGDGIPDNIDPSPLDLLTMISGDQQIGPTNQFLPYAFVVQVNQNSLPAAGKSVKFSVTQGGGGVAASQAGSPTATVTITSDANGRAAAYFKTPKAAAEKDFVKATYIVGTQTNTVTFTAYSSDARIAWNNLMVWYKSDLGLVTNTLGKVTRWFDKSGKNNDAVQTVTNSMPAFVSSSINSLPAVAFDGIANKMNLPAGFNDFTAGFTAFVVTKPVNTTTNAALIDFGNGHYADNLIFGRGVTDGTAVSLQTFVGSSRTGNMYTTNTIASGSYQLLTAVHNGTNGGAFYKNGSVISVLSGGAIANVNRTKNLLGKDGMNSSRYFEGNIAEVLVYNRELSQAEIINVSDYLGQKYALYSATVQAPQFLPNGGSFTTNVYVKISCATPGSQIYYTTNGVEPTQLSLSYSGSAINVKTTTTLRARAFATGYSPSLISYANFEKKGANSPNSFSGLQLWLRSDAGVVMDPAGKVFTWADQSGNGMDASQSSLAPRPTWPTNAVAGKPVIRFNGSNQFLRLPSGFSNFTTGMTAVVVTKPSNIGNRGGFFDLSMGASSSNNVIFAYSGTNNTLNFTVFNQLAKKTLDAASAVSSNSFQALAVLHDGNLTASEYRNGELLKTGGVTNLVNALRTKNQIGKNLSSGDTYLQGDIAEILIYNRKLQDTEFANVTDYLNLKYQIGPTTVHLPIITPNGGVISGAQTVSITCDTQNAAIYFTTNGSEPTTSTILYTQPFAISGSTVVKAKGFLSGYNPSPLAYAGFDNVANSPNNFNKLILWLRADAGVQRDNTGKVTSWLDQSGGSMNAVPTNALTSPSWTTNSINTKPAIVFNGTNQFLKLPSGFSDFSNGFSAFVVSKPNGTNSRAAFFDLGNGGKSNNVIFAHTGTTFNYASYLGNVISQIDVPGAVNTNNSCLFSATGPRGSGAFQSSIYLRVYTNNVSQIGGSYVGFTNVFRDRNQIGKGLLSTDRFYQGSIAEIVLYNRYLSDQEFQDISDYLALKYGVYKPTLQAPQFSPSGGNIFPGQMVSITSHTPGASIYYTTNGSTPTTSSFQFITNFSFNAPATLKAKSFLIGYNPSAVASAFFTVPTQVPPPVINPSSGTFIGSPEVTMTTVPNANIFYTLDRTDPTTNSLKYLGPFKPTLPAYIIARAFLTGYNDSLPSKADLRRPTVDAPQISPNGGIYPTTQNISLSCATNNASIYYTTNGTQPSGSSILYTGPFPLPGTCTISAIGILTNYNNSSITTASFTKATVPTPFTSPIDDAVFTSNLLVTLNTTLAGSTIYYTTNGLDPTTSSLIYTNPILLNSSTRIKAKATHPDYNDSPLLSHYFERLTNNNPSDLGGLKCWLRSDIGVSTNTSGSITNWVDISKNGASVSQKTQSAQPLLIPNVVNGKPVIRVDGQDDSLKGQISIGGSKTLCVVLKDTGTASPMGGIVAFSSQGTQLNGIFSDLGQSIVVDWEGATAANSAHTVESSSQFEFLVAKYDNSKSEISIYRNGALVETKPLFRGLAATDLEIGTRNDELSRYFKGDIAEVVCYDHALSLFEQQQVESYFSSRYGLFASKVSSVLATPNPGTYLSNLSISLTNQTVGATNYYTLDGTEPTTLSIRYTTPIILTTDKTIKAKAFKKDFDPSDTLVLDYHIDSASKFTREGLKVWLRADSGVVKDASNKVQQWTDQSGYLNHAIPGVVTNQPLMNLNKINGLPVVSFDGIKSWMVTPVLSLSSNQFTLIAIWKKDGVPTGIHSLLSRASDFNSTSPSVQLWSSNGTTKVTADLLGTGGDCKSTSNFDTNNYKITSVTRQDFISNGTKLYVNSNLEGQSSTTAANIQMGSDGRIFIGGLASKYAKASIAEIFVYDRVLSSKDRSSIELYLSRKYNITSDIDADGLSDFWENYYFGSTATQNGADDTDGDGLSNISEQANGTDPTDYYNGASLTFGIKSGNNQTGPLNNILSQPFVVSVTTNGLALTNAPVSFTVLFGSGQLATNTTVVSSPFAVRTDTNGLASIKFKLSALPGELNQVSATLISGITTNQLVFNAMALNVLPYPWLEKDVGTVGFGGITTFETNTFSISASGSDISGTSDSFHYVYQPLTGNGQIITRVTGIQKTHNNAKAGLMIRESLNSNSRHTFINLQANGPAQFSYRTSTGGSATTTNSVVTNVAPYWLKLERSGNIFSGYTSIDKITWTPLSSQTITMSTNAFIGMAVTSRNNALLGRSTFDNTSVGFLDSDNDGLPDAWEIQNFGNLNQGANDDPDHDLITNIQEYRRGSNPNKVGITVPSTNINLKLFTPFE